MTAAEVQANYQSMCAPRNPNFELTDSHVRTPSAEATLTVDGGATGAIAVLINSDDWDSAVWEPFRSSLVIPSGRDDGVYEIQIGFRSLYANPKWESLWVGTKVTLDRVPPVITRLTPASGTTTSRPEIELSGYANEELDSMTGTLTTSQGETVTLDMITLDPQFDPEQFKVIGTSFEVMDIELTEGTNTVQLQFTGLAGNVSSQTLNYTLSSASDTTAPQVTLNWPVAGTMISGNLFSFDGQVDDPTAIIIGRITLNGVVTEQAARILRSGQFWIQDLPLEAGNHVLEIIATNAAGNSATNTIPIEQSEVVVAVLTVDVQQDPTLATVTGFVSDSTLEVFVNGVKATVGSATGNWTASNVPIGSRGVVSIQTTAQETNNGPGKAGAKRVVNKHP